MGTSEVILSRGRKGTGGGPGGAGVAQEDRLLPRQFWRATTLMYGKWIFFFFSPARRSRDNSR